VPPQACLAAVPERFQFLVTGIHCESSRRLETVVSLLASALADLRTEVLTGADPADLVEEIAAAYGVKPALLTRKFKESYRSAEALRATFAETDQDARTERQIKRACERYGVLRKDVFEILAGGVRFSVIGRFSGNAEKPYVVLRHNNTRFYYVEDWRVGGFVLFQQEDGKGAVFYGRQLFYIGPLETARSEQAHLVDAKCGNNRRFHISPVAVGDDWCLYDRKKNVFIFIGPAARLCAELRSATLAKPG
jgi:hypothetical protein